MALDNRLHLVKRKHLKRLVTTRHLSRNIILGATLGRRKKKHKAGHCSSRKLDGDQVVSDLGPSTSKKSKILSTSCLAYPPRRLKSNSDEKDKVLGLKNFTDHANLHRGVKDVPSRDVIVQHGKVLLTDTEPRKSFSFTLVEKSSDTGKSCGSIHKKCEHVENGLLNMLTRGLKETIVTRWDGVEHSPEFVESRSTKSLRIGYVGGEWDEKYDTGKRKKIRSSKLNFDGSNPFQEIAMQKIKTKKAKLDRFSSANRPFRI